MISFSESENRARFGLYIALLFWGRQEVAQAIADGEVVAWFQGRSEFGPRALGSRSLLADPRDPGMPSRINKDVKKRRAVGGVCFILLARQPPR